jgi:hypothetical protein
LIAGFIQHWHESGAGERSNFQSFVRDLCDLLGVPRPNPTRPDDRDNAYVFERAVRVLAGLWVGVLWSAAIAKKRLRLSFATLTQHNFQSYVEGAGVGTDLS